MAYRVVNTGVHSDLEVFVRSTGSNKSEESEHAAFLKAINTKMRKHAMSTNMKGSGTRTQTYRTVRRVFE